MREKYESLSVTVLRDLAKARGLKGLSGLKKSELVERMLAEDEKEAKKEQEAKTAKEMKKGQDAKAEIEAGAKEEIKDDTDGKAAEQETTGIPTRDELDSGITVNGILEVMPDGYGFIRGENYLPGEKDVYVSPSQIRKFNLKTGDIISGNTRIKTQQEKFSALLYVNTINGLQPGIAQRRKNFEDLTPVFPDERIRLERPGASVEIGRAHV